MVNFQRLTAETYELEPETIREEVEGAWDLRQAEKAWEANAMINVTINEELSRD